MAAATPSSARSPILGANSARTASQQQASDVLVGSAVPSTAHEMPLLLLRESPIAVATLVREAFGIEVGDALVAASTSFSELAPAAYAADLVLVGEAVLVVEVQRARDEKKRSTWPLYVASAHAAHRLPTWLVVIALDASVAAWARRPIESFHGGVFAPLVVGPAEVPRIVDPRVASRMPELAVLSALAHGRAPRGEDVGAAALFAAAAVARQDEDRGKLYADAVMHALGDAARDALEVAMKAQGYEYQSDFARKYVAQGLEQGRREGREEGREEGLRTAVRVACELLGLGWSDERETLVSELGATDLAALLDAMQRERRWPR